MGALLGRGLRLDLLDEHDWTSFARFPWLVETDEEEFVDPRGPRPGAPVVHPGGQSALTVVPAVGPRPAAGSAGSRSAQPLGSSGFRTVQPAPDTLRGS